MRLRRDIKFKRPAAFEQPEDKEQDIPVDEAIRLTGDDTGVRYSHSLRRVVVYRPYEASRHRNKRPESASEASEEVIELVTNNAR